MISKLRKLVGKDDETRNHADFASGSRAMPALGAQLQMRFAKGINYNMKIVIRGDKNVGKTCLLLRLQGMPFKEEYVPSEEIQVANIQWNYRTADDVVKVEFWDVVDKGKKRKAFEGLKIQNGAKNGDQNDQLEIGLDAETLDVYKGAHGVVFLFDITKPWTFDYIKKELEKTPSNLPILIMANHRDMGHHQKGMVSAEMASAFIRHFERPPGSAQILVTESSMRNGFGLKYLHKFLNLSFLQLQRETLERQLEQNRLDTGNTFFELENIQESSEQSYEAFSQNLADKRRTAADSQGPPATAGAVNGKPSNSNHAVPAPTLSKPKDSDERSPAVPGPAEASVPRPSVSLPQPQSGKPVPVTVESVKRQTQPRNIDEFVPEENLSNDFLDDAQAIIPAKPTGASYQTYDQDGSEDELNENPMVASFQEEVEIDSIPLPVAHHSPIVRSSESLEESVPKLSSPGSNELTFLEDQEETVNGQSSDVSDLQFESAENDQVHSGGFLDRVAFNQAAADPVSETAKSPEDSSGTALQPTTTSTSISVSADEFSSWLETVSKPKETTKSLSVEEPANVVESPQKAPKEKRTKPKSKSSKSKTKSIEVPSEKPAPEKTPSVQTPKAKGDDDLQRELEDFLASD